MAFTTGQIKTGGRKKGTPNKCNGDVKKLVAAIVSKELKGIDALLLKADADTRLNFIIKLLPFILPKMQDVSITEEATAPHKSYDDIVITEEMKQTAIATLMARHDAIVKDRTYFN